MTPAAGWSLYALRREWNARKHDVAPWWAENSKEAYNSGLLALSRALGNWSDSRSGRRAGRPVGFPRFRRRGTVCGVRFTTGAIRVEPDRHHVTLPRLGRIHTMESTRKLARRVEAGTARILAASVTCDARGRWFVAFTVEVQRAVGRAGVPAHRAAGAYRVVGIDLGVKDVIVAATPDGREVARLAAPRSLNRAQRRLRGLQRAAARQQGRWKPDPSAVGGGHRQDASNRWKRTRARIAKTHQRAANIRADVLRKATSELARIADVVVVEDLNVAGMSRRKPGAGKGGRGLNRAIADASLATVRRQFDYKTGWYGSQLVVIDRWYPSSKTCSGCGAVKAKLSLAERTYECEQCGIVIDRDLNAAINIARTGEQQLLETVSPAKLGVSSLAKREGEGYPFPKGDTPKAGSAPATGRGGGTTRERSEWGSNQKTQTARAAGAGADEASTPHQQPLDQTGSAPSQGEAA
ncbi:MAG: IS607 family element RNA-guided endonuclease TnpB [Candidatus Nanopelagicales bacterium]|nr:IS607 family element RNA-guided endonuclease TnpB [Candidatus Nanopelagicales bacterium]MDZ4250150.1 IS607 family element RNA-guided endonuclease TnpB [Candidatus Nanopelagicales bacterium]